MCNTTIKNLSTLTDCAALLRVVDFISGNEDSAFCDKDGKQIVNIEHTSVSYGRDIYVISDFIDSNVSDNYSDLDLKSLPFT